MQQLSPAIKDDGALRQQLAAMINQLINTNFEQVVYLLYTVDVSESLLKNTLQKNADKDAGELIADLLIARQLEKIKAKEESRKQAPPDDSDEKW